jgi:CRISPR/Cas system-associated protein Cas5 (RAMP superfamily)
MKRSEEIFGGLNTGSFSVKKYIREHKVGLLGTIAFHLILLISFLLMDIQSLKKEASELDITLDFTEESNEESETEEEQETAEERFARLLEQQLQQSNRAVNVKKLEEEISTEKYVEDIMKELENERSEDWLKQQEEIENIMNQEDIVPVEPVPDEKNEEKEYAGPTNISYEFLAEPFDRQSFDLPIPVYKCRGYGVVEVSVEVDNSGNVISAKPRVIEAAGDPECLSEVAQKFALQTQFRADFNAPSAHRGKIVYSFIAQ